MVYQTTFRWNIYSATFVPKISGIGQLLLKLLLVVLVVSFFKTQCRAASGVGCVFGGRCHALSVGGQCVRHADVEPIDDALSNQNQYRNYTDSRYSVFVDLLRTSVCSCPLVSSRVEKTMTVGGQPPCQLRVTLYPQVGC